MKVVKGLLVLLILLLIAGCQNSSASSRSGANANGQQDKPVANTGQSAVARGGDQKGPARPSYKSPVPVIVTEGKRSSRTADDLPAGCKPRQAAAIVATYVDAFNRGDRELLDRLFQPLPKSELPDWAGQDLAFFYGLGEVYSKEKVRGFDFGYGEKDRLLAYFAGRQQLGERLELWEVLFGPQAMQGAKNTVSMQVLYSRRAPDLKPGLGGPERLVVAGKGAIDCERQAIFGWSASMEMVGVKGLDVPPFVKRGTSSGAFCKDPPGWKPGESVITCI